MSAVWRTVTRRKLRRLRREANRERRYWGRPSLWVKLGPHDKIHAHCLAAQAGGRGLLDVVDWATNWGLLPVCYKARQG